MFFKNILISENEIATKKLFAGANIKEKKAILYMTTEK
jgi:hypothetical protein